MNKIKKLLMSLILSLIFMSGYGHTAKTELVISAASSMSDVLREIIQIYESLVKISLRKIWCTGLRVMVSI